MSGTHIYIETVSAKGQYVVENTYPEMKVKNLHYIGHIQK